MVFSGRYFLFYRGKKHRRKFLLENETLNGYTVYWRCSKKLIFRGDKLAKLRHDMGWSTYDVERLTSIRQSVISDLENGATKNPRQSTIEKLCKGLKVSKEFFYMDDAKLPSELLPDMPEETKRFIMNGNNIPYIMISEKAKKEGIPHDVLENMLKLLIQNRDK